MPPSEKQPFYDPIPPTYDQALAGSSRHGQTWPPPRTHNDDDVLEQTEAQGLLHRSNGAGGSSRHPNGYHPPTVESDDSDIASLLESDTDDEEAAQVRREVEEMEIEEPTSSRGLSWGKRIGFALPRWKWSWRPRLPRISLPRMRIQLPSRPEDDGEETRATEETRNNDEDSESNTPPRRSWAFPGVNGMVVLLIFARVLAVTIIFGFLYLVFATDFFSSFGGRMNGGFRFRAEDLRVHILGSVEPRRLRASVLHFSKYAHIAGTEGDYATAMDVKSMFIKAGLDQVSVDEYEVYINYPRKDGRSVQIVEGDNVIWTAQLDEIERGQEMSGHQPYAFHGHSKSGDVKGPLIYANYGSREDFKRIKDKGIDTQGAIALVRYFGTQTDRALKVKAAELAGFAGCLIYTDPADDGFVKGEVAPKGRYMPPDGVQRGAVSLMSWAVGDVLTPGWPSIKGKPRIKPKDAPALVKIPSLPLAWRDAQALLKSLKGHGERVPEEWKGGVPEVDEWWTGDAKSPIVRLRNEQDENTKQPIWNVYGQIVGMEQSAKSIIIGNHRDAWSFGATDPHSGTAVMIEMARIFGDLVARGWRPLRTIQFMSWDAEEYNLIGSTEFVENNLDTLRNDAYAYINLDTAVAGDDFHASGSPVFEQTLLRALNRIADPKRNHTLRELWNDRHGELEGLGAGSDYVAFQDIAGTSSLDLEFRGEKFPYHSSYDNFELVEKVIDPDFVYHGLMAQLVGLIILDLADRLIVPFDLVAYGRKLGTWVDNLEKWASGKLDEGVSLPFQELRDAASLVVAKAGDFSKWEQRWEELTARNGGWETSEIGGARMDYNNRMGTFDTLLLDTEQGGGIPNRNQFKHVVFGPQLWSGYDEAFFPAIRDMVDEKNWGEAERFIQKTAGLIRNAAESLTT
ncbi:unnamed protein product [Clonostachys byssicola]|uniref:Uncharacterized protein n=1 Tax=Clonostachys byssicola TaxID=160290 RepID=A0A9N9U523_9HYPO|nr:unnamed protein product [Clonostachys byssicola]